MNKHYGYILIAYIVMQLAGAVGPLLFYKAGTEVFGQTKEYMHQVAVGSWLIFSFAATLIIVLLILRKSSPSKLKLERSAPAAAGISIVWAVVGIFMAFFAQAIAIQIETLLGIQAGSENTQNIMGIVDNVPLAMIVVAIIGPILEEIVFRKIIFGALYQRMNFFFAALISSVIFALAHFEPVHVILYSAMGFTFAFLYVRTKRILVPICAHVAMNTMVVIMQTVYRDEIEKIMNEAEKIQGFIGGFL
ncbi:CPBP family intramembrane glutamic endopeptidase [Rossellomorea marisflavi]|uniref:CPBP family intramembrane glutamic endopeptidase n=1 Tax=Rossellomorea marisflavi TaxID=189381 RepID=UPI003D2F2D71